MEYGMGNDLAEDAFGADAEPERLFAGDEGTLEASARRALTLLLRDPYVCALTNPSDFACICDHQRQLRRALNDLGLTLTISGRYEVAYASQADLDRAGPLMLKRAQPLRRDATLLLVSLRARQHNEEASGIDDWFCTREEMRSLLESGPYAQELDGSRLERGLDTAIKQLEEAGYLRQTQAADTWRVMPILPATFTLERARELLATLTKEADE